MTDLLAGAIPTPPTCCGGGSQPWVVPPVLPSPEPAVGASLWRFLLLGGVVVPNPEGSPSDPASAPASRTADTPPVTGVSDALFVTLGSWWPAVGRRLEPTTPVSPS